MTTIAILGANGVYARHLIPRLVGAGFRVRALVRRMEAAGLARACRADICQADIFDPGSLRAGLEGCEICINLATSLPGPSGRGDYAVNDQVRREGVPQLIRACRDAGTGRLLQQSIAMIAADGENLTDENLTDEDAVHAPAGTDIAGRAIEAAIEMEEAVRASELDWLILRGGLFYGPGTGFDDDWFARAAAGKLRLPRDGSDFVSLVHIADMAAATVAAVALWPSRRIINVTDDEPSRWRDVFDYVAQLAGADRPQPGGRMGFPSFRVSNARARALLDWAPRYPDYRSGLVR